MVCITSCTRFSSDKFLTIKNDDFENIKKPIYQNDYYRNLVIKKEDNEQYIKSYSNSFRLGFKSASKKCPKILIKDLLLNGKGKGFDYGPVTTEHNAYFDGVRFYGYLLDRKADLIIKLNNKTFEKKVFIEDIYISLISNGRLNNDKIISHINFERKMGNIYDKESYIKSYISKTPYYLGIEKSKLISMIEADIESMCNKFMP